MRWYFRDISDDPSEKELTQQDQFNNDEVALAEAIVRETVQNSTDAQAGSNGQVRVRFAVNTIDGPDRTFFDEVIQSLAPHLRACGMPVPGPTEPLRALVIEDFGTTGVQRLGRNKGQRSILGVLAEVRPLQQAGCKGRPVGLGKAGVPLGVRRAHRDRHDAAHKGKRLLGHGPSRSAQPLDRRPGTGFGWILVQCKGPALRLAQRRRYAHLKALTRGTTAAQIGARPLPYRSGTASRHHLEFI